MRKSASWICLAGLATFALASCGAEPIEPQEQEAASDTIDDEFPVIGPQRRILAFGDSLFASYGLEKEQGYPARLERVLRAQGINAEVVDAGVSGDTTAAGLQRIAFVLDNEDGPIDLAIVELGGNDFLRGLRPSATRENLRGIVEELQSRDVPVLLMGMRAPPNMGAEFLAEFDGIYPDLAAEYDTALVPFFLEAIYADISLFQADRLHPTAEGIEEIVAATAGSVAAALPEPD